MYLIKKKNGFKCMHTLPKFLTQTLSVLRKWHNSLNKNTSG